MVGHGNDRGAGVWAEEVINPHRSINMSVLDTLIGSIKILLLRISSQETGVMNWSMKF